MLPEGRVLLIANPAAQIGNGREAAEKALGLLSDRLGAGRVELALTQQRGHAVEMAESAEGFSTVIGLGGDGLMHEVANGLMRRAPEDRPVFGVLPVGSGNDYAKSLSMSAHLASAVAELAEHPVLATDVGLCNGEHFLETLSFGVDVAIALGTEERRVRTGRTGTRLYLEEGLDQVVRHRVERAFRLEMDGGCRVEYRRRAIASEGERVRSAEGALLLMAVQVGPTYGGGFRIAPGARLDDGVLDLCIANAPLGPVRAAYIFLRAKDGNHTGFSQVDFYRARSLRVEFDEEPPAQIDGERITGTSFDVEVIPRALRVIRKQ